MASSCLDEGTGCRCEYVDIPGTGQTELQWKIDDCTQGAFADACRDDIKGTPKCKVNDGKAACECEM